jgi:hypothetical protein
MSIQQAKNPVLTFQRHALHFVRPVTGTAFLQSLFWRERHQGLATLEGVR